MENKLARPKGLLSIGNSYFFQARIPKQYLKHYSKSIIKEKLPTDSYTEAVRLVYSRWAELHQEYKIIDSTGKPTSPDLYKQTLSLETMKNIVEQMVYSKIAEDGAMRSRGYHSNQTYKARALNKLANDEDLVKEAISRGNYEGLEDSAKSWLRGNGYILSPDSPETQTFYELFAEGLARVNTAIRERDKGNLITEPSLPVSFRKSEDIDWDSLDKLKEYWLLQPAKSSGGKKSRTAEAEATTIIKKFKEMVGDIKPSEITRSHIADLKDKMLEAGSSPATINKGRGILATIFSNAEKNAKLENNPFKGMEKLSVGNGDIDRQYSIEELQIIFSSPIYKTGERPKRFNGESAFWIPLLALYSGARLNELGQIFTKDIGIEDGISYFIIRPDESTGRSTKDGNKRKVPIHNDLIKMGFLGYVDRVRVSNSIQLFPELKLTRSDGKLADKFGSWWCSYVRKELKITRIPQPMHGFRHTFIDHSRRCKIDNELRRIIEGHAPTTVEFKSYKREFYPLEPLDEEIQKLNIKGLNLSHLYK